MLPGPSAQWSRSQVSAEVVSILPMACRTAWSPGRLPAAWGRPEPPAKPCQGAARRRAGRAGLRRIRRRRRTVPAGARGADGDRLSPADGCGDVVGGRGHGWQAGSCVLFADVPVQFIAGAEQELAAGALHWHRSLLSGQAAAGDGLGVPAGWKVRVPVPHRRRKGLWTADPKPVCCRLPARCPRAGTHSIGWIGVAGHSSSRAPRTAASRVKRSAGSVAA